MMMAEIVSKSHSPYML